MTPTQWHIAGLRYPSGREIFVGSHPERAEFHAVSAVAAQWPGEAAALQAADDLKSAFRLLSPELLTTFTIPV
ncbi:MAG: hypothetical protein U1E02_26630 [Hydrogenophaga sp.]|nr:hypothetical protein [Luteolibacter sp.]MDZ4127714.1 hypothetical protein [Hydrogenophaga sp.]